MRSGEPYINTYFPKKPKGLYKMLG